MQTTDELFADRGGVNAFHDTVVGPDEKLSPEDLRARFEQLPETVRNLAHSWGLSDTVFRDEAHTARLPFRRLRDQAQDKGKYDHMLQSLRVAENGAELAQLLMLFVMDMSYGRADVLLAEKSIKLEKGWT